MNSHENARTLLASSHGDAGFDSQNGTGSNEALRKRKRESLDLSRVSDWFDAKIITSNRPPVPSLSSFSPIATVLRAHVPLSWLSNCSSPDSKNGCLLQADIDSLTRWEYSVLIARQVPNGGLYALEKVEKDTYVCFLLRDFVTVDWVKRAAVGAAPLVTLGCVLQRETALGHQRTPSISSNVSSHGLKDGASSPKQPRNRRGVLARQVILSKPTPSLATENLPVTPGNGSIVGGTIIHSDIRPSEPALQHESLRKQPEVSLSGDNDQVHQETVLDEVETYAVPSVPELQEDKAPSVDQLSQEYLRKRYLEMLYLSKTSLAFYAKGPLSRTRARARANGASMTLESLAVFYRDSVIPVKKLDLKYKESVPSKIALLASSHDMEQQNDIQHASKSKKPKRTKLGKDALWPVEDEFIRKWWHDRSLGGELGSSAEALSADMQRRLPSLRMREIQLQVILILEILSLESQQSQATAELAGNPHDFDIETEANVSSEVTTKSTSTKKSRNLRAELEVLLDRICILHSVGFEDVVNRYSDKISGKQLRSDSTKDELKDFCKEVVIPFYSGKLADECKSVCRKLGGLDLSPQRIRPGEVRAIPQPLPGTAISSGERAGTKRTLTRVLSVERKSQTGSPPVLLRSATLPAVTNTKREQSERPKSRGGVQKSLSFTSREIDLVADAQVTAAKRRKLDRIVAQKRELEAAIDALKKPNRLVAAKSFMDDVESRATESRNPSRRNDPIQITATPKISRVKPTLVDEYELPPITMVKSKSEDVFVPSSAVKPRGLSHVSGIARSSARKKAVLSAIHNTPLRQNRTHLGSIGPETENDAETNPGSRDQSSSTLVDSTPTVSRRRPIFTDTIFSTPTQAEKQRHAFLITPAKRNLVSVEAVFKDVPEIPEAANKMMDRVMKNPEADVETSIYESLGWTNDDYDI